MQKLRGTLFLVSYYAVLIFFLIVLLPTILMPRRAIAYMHLYCSHGIRLAQKLIMGVTIEVRGLENMPKGSVLVAAKHQSAWETFMLALIIRDPSYVLKEELMSIPLFGLYMRKLDMVNIVRGSGAEALKRMKESAVNSIREGRPIVVFPEGTRTLPGAEPDYKSGVAHLYREFDLPCVPVALNSGVFWPKNGTPSGPGKIIVQFGPVIPAGLAPRAFRNRLRDETEAMTDALLLESADHGWGTLGPLGEARVKLLRERTT